MSVQKSSFGFTKDRREASLFTLDNGRGMRAVLSDFGATLVSLFLPGRTGAEEDLVLGYDRLADYERPGFFGATVGRNANRIAGASFELDGQRYFLAANDRGNNLHTDFEKGFHKVLWRGEILPGRDAVRFSYLSPDGENGFPGQLEIAVTYELLPDQGLRLVYEGVSDRKTLINLTNHSFFNLSGHDSGDIGHEKVTIWADTFAEIGPHRIPTGRLLPVDGTPMDFRTPRRIGDDIDSDWPQIALARGYDHSWVPWGDPGVLRKIARVDDDRSGRSMEVWTDLPCVQFYTANYVPAQRGKGGAFYDRRGALCMETQYLPDSIHHPNFLQPVFRAGQPYRGETLYRFSL